MGYVTCNGGGNSPSHRSSRACWRCDRCPKCDNIGRLLRGDYCRDCTNDLIASGFVWSDYAQNYVVKNLTVCDNSLMDRMEDN